MAFRNRFSEQDLAAILEASVPKVETGEQDDSDDGNDPPNSGTPVLDATCCPADIAYPQDIDLLNQVREKAEKTVDELGEAAGQKKPRMYRKHARKDYLRLSKAKKRSGKAIRSAVRKQLQYMKSILASCKDVGFENSADNVTLGPMKRPGEPEEMANASVFLCSEDAS